MPPDPELVAETRDWLDRAADDLRAGELLLGAAPPLPVAAAFHAQQAAEKALKAFLTWHSRPFRKTHDLAEIGGLCVAIDATLDTPVRRAAVLSECAWRFRYPGAPRPLGPAEAAEALGLARAVYAAVVARLPGEVRP
jgi:HEPN domain-containing protein